MKSIITSVIFLLLTGVAVNTEAQEDNERVEAMRVAFIAKKLDLTVEESQQFWPVYNEYEAARKSIKKEQKRRRPNQDMSEAEAEAFVMQSLETEQKLLDLKKSYFQKFKKVVSVKKIARLQQVEREFRKELLERVRQRREQRGGGGMHHGN